MVATDGAIFKVRLAAARPLPIPNELPWLLQETFHTSAHEHQRRVSSGKSYIKTFNSIKYCT